MLVGNVYKTNHKLTHSPTEVVFQTNVDLIKIPPVKQFSHISNMILKHAYSLEEHISIIAQRCMYTGNHNISEIPLNPRSALPFLSRKPK